LKDHPFFKEINWTDIRNQTMTPPWIPELKNEVDCSNFDNFDEKEPWLSSDLQIEKKIDFNYVGFT